MAFNFKDRYNEENYNGTLIVDALNLAFRWKHTSNYANFKEEFARTISSIANSYKCGRIIITADWGHSSFRRELYPEYKADRAERYKDQTEEEKEQFEKFFAEYEATLDYLKENYLVLRFRSTEADDIAAHLVLHREQYELKNIWLLSSDDDWSLLVNKGVGRFSWRTRKEVTCENWYEHYDIAPEQFISYKCIIGDKSDNIPGVIGIGPKRAAGLLKEYDNMFDIIDAMPLPGKAKYIQNLNESGDILIRNFELMSLLDFCDTAIGEENLKTIRGNFDVPW